MTGTNVAGVAKDLEAAGRGRERLHALVPPTGSEDEGGSAGEEGKTRRGY